MTALTRRKLLSYLGVAAVGGVGTGIVLGSSESPHPEPTVGTVDPDTDPVSEDETPYAVWQYRADGDGMVSTAPINVVFPLASASFEDVVSVFEETGWYSDPAEYARYAWDRKTQNYRLQQWTGAETYFGLAGRLHVRCWELDDTASVQAHVDTPATPRHRIASYADGRDAVEQLFRTAGWTVESEREPLGNDRNPDHDGLASVITAGDGR